MFVFSGIKDVTQSKVIPYVPKGSSAKLKHLTVSNYHYLAKATLITSYSFKYKDTAILKWLQEIIFLLLSRFLLE